MLCLRKKRLSFLAVLWYCTLVITLTTAFLPASDAYAADTTPPLTTTSPIMGTYGTAQGVTLTCDDSSGSGCAATYYCLGAGCTPTTQYTGPVSIEATTSLSFYSTDLDGNSEQIRTYAYTIDPALSYRFERLWPELPQPWYFNNASGVVVDTNGNIYVADTDNNRIQKFDARGAFVNSWGTYGSSNGQFKNPKGIAADATGNVYVADTGNHRIQKFNSAGAFVTAWGVYGSGNSQFYAPQSLAVDISGSVYVADTMNNRIKKFTGTGSFVTAWGTAGSGFGQFTYPKGISVDSVGYIYVADSNNNRIQKFDANGTFVTTWGSSGGGNGQFQYPYGVATDSDGNVYVAEGNRVQKFSSSGTFLSKWGSLGGGNGQIWNAFGIAADPAGFVYVADTYNKRIQKFSTTGSFVGSLGDPDSSTTGHFRTPEGIAINTSGTLYVVDSYNSRIQKLDSSGAFIAAWGSYGYGNGQFNSPRNIAVDANGYVYVVEWSSNHRIQKFDSSGAFIASWGSYGSGNGQFSNPCAIAADANGYLLVADSGNNRIQKFTSSGSYVTSWGSYGSGNGQFSSPQGIAVDGNGYIYVLEVGNNRIQKFDANGTFITSWGSYGTGSGQFNSPRDLKVDGNGNLFVADSGNNRIQKFSTSGAYVSSWGSFGSDNGQFSNPYGVAVDTAGNVYVVESNNNRIQKFMPTPQTPPGAPAGVTATAGNGLATVAFTTPATNGGSAITFYTVISNPDNITTTGSTSPIIVTGLTNGTAYTFTVAATNANGTGAASSPSNSVTPFVPTYSLSLVVNGSGTVHSIPVPDINCSGSCGQSYDSGTIVSLTASPGSGFIFSGWSGVCSGTGSCAVTMDQARTVTATFTSSLGNGMCGSAHNSNSALAPDAGLCDIGTPSAVSGIGPWTWTCAGSGGEATASCSAAQAGGIVHRSSDSGVTWTPGSTGLDFNNPTNAIVVSPLYTSDHTVFIGANSGIYRSSDSGDTWTQVLTTYMVKALAASPAYATDHTLFGGDYLSGFYKSTDSGSTWSQNNTGLGNTMIFSLVVSPAYATDHTVYAGLYSKGVYKSTDGGATWSAANTGIDTVHALSLVISPAYATDRTVFVSTSDNHVYRSVDAGATWTLADTGLSGTTLLAISPVFSSDQTLFAAKSSGIYKSSDRGNSWVQMNSTVSVSGLALSPAYASDQTVFFTAYGDNVFRSSNGGSSWSPSNSSFPVGRKQLTTLALSPAYASDHAVFAATYLAGPYILTSPGSVAFGSVIANSSSPSQQVTITSGNGVFGDANLAITGITVTGADAGQFSISPGSCGTLTPALPVGSSCSVDVTFTPGSAGSKSATLQITHNNISQLPQSISLSGNGTVSVASTITSPTIGTYTNSTSVAVAGSATCSGCTVSLMEVSGDNGATWQPAIGTTSWSASVPTTAVGTYTLRSRATTSGGIVETPGSGITVTVDRTPPTGTLALYYGVWTLNATDGGICIQLYPFICGSLEMSTNGSFWQTATTTPGTDGPLWLRDPAGNTAYISGGSLANTYGGPIKTVGGSNTYYSLLQHAFDFAGSGNVFKITAAQYTENLVASAATSFTVKGGYDSSHYNVTGTTRINGSLAVQASSLTLENIDLAGEISINGGAVTAQSLSIL